jgi:hypothetical protein
MSDEVMRSIRSLAFNTPRLAAGEPPLTDSEIESILADEQVKRIKEDALTECEVRAQVERDLDRWEAEQAALDDCG